MSRSALPTGVEAFRDIFAHMQVQGLACRMGSDMHAHAHSALTGVDACLGQPYQEGAWRSMSMVAVQCCRGKCCQVYNGASHSFHCLLSAWLHARASRTALDPARCSPGEAVKVSLIICHYTHTHAHRFIAKICGAEELHGRGPCTIYDHWFLLLVHIFINPSRIYIIYIYVCIYMYMTLVRCWFACMCGFV
jgi:hypothetical protein